MGMGLRGNRMPSNSSNNGGNQESQSQKKVNDGRNRLKNMVAGELGLKKPPLTISSQMSSQES